MDDSGDDRSGELRRLAEVVAEHDAVRDAWLAKSFTDRLFVVEVAGEASLPDAVAERCHEHDLVGYNDCHDVSAPDVAFAGAVEDGTRYRFVDVTTRGSLQSYVVD